MRESLKKFSKFFVQNKESKALLKSIGFENVTVSGDTRFDRVGQILERDNQLKFMDEFKVGQPCFVAGSTWPEDEEVILDFINNSKGIKIVIAPHNIKAEHILDLQHSIQKKVVAYSQHEGLDLSGFDVLIVDTIGLLTRIYSYADITFVGGGFKTGLHNTLEPAIFGIPVLIGPKFKGFAEAESLVEKGGVISIKTKEDASSTLEKLFDNRKLRNTLGKRNKKFIMDNLGATATILDHIKSIL